MYDRPIKVLFIEDDPGDVELIRWSLEETPEFGRIDLETANRLSAGVARLGEGGVDAVLLDLGLPDSSGLETLAAVLGARPEAAVVVLTGLEDMAVAMEALQAGAQDYLIKGECEGRLLVRSIYHAVERKRAEEALRASEEKYRLVSENIPVVVYSALPDDHSSSLFVSGRAEELTGYCAEEFLSDPKFWPSIVHPDDEDRVWEEIRNHRRNKTDLEVEYRIVTKDSVVKWIRDRATPMLDENGQITRIDGFMEDITKRKQAVEDLERMFNLSGYMICIADIDGYFRKINPAFGQTLGYTDEEFLGRPFLEFVHPDDKEKTMAVIEEKLSAGVQVIGFENRYRCKDGSYKWLRWTSQPVVEEGIVFGIAYDVTERKRAEMQLTDSHRQLRALADHLQTVREEERTDLARRIHDELGHDLTAMKMDLSRLSKSMGRAAGGEILETMEAILRHVDATIQSLRDTASELRPGILDDLGLLAAIEWEVRRFQERTGIRSEINTSAEEFDLDRKRSTALFRICQEVLANVAEHANASRARVSLRLHERTAVLEVSDDGRGITDQELSSRSALGILGMRERALVFGGGVNITGTPGKGTMVTVRIPLGPDE